MAKKIITIIKLALPAGKATPAPPIGPALGQHGINIIGFCNDYNKKTLDKEGLIIPAEITIYDDRNYSFVLKTPPASILLAKAANISKGASLSNKIKNVFITKSQLEDIAKIKIPDLNTKNIINAMKIIEGTAKNMGISIKNN